MTQSNTSYIKIIRSKPLKTAYKPFNSKMDSKPYVRVDKRSKGL
jgi:hypothetical protein